MLPEAPRQLGPARQPHQLTCLEEQDPQVWRLFAYAGRERAAAGTRANHDQVPRLKEESAAVEAVDVEAAAVAYSHTEVPQSHGDAGGGGIG